MEKKVSKVCQGCKKTFLVSFSDNERGRGKFCSRPCYGKWFSENLAGKDSKNWRRIKRNCQECGKEFFVAPIYIRRNGGKFCSHECAGRKQEKNPNWRGGKIEKVCIVCGTKLYKTLSKIKASGGKFCSLKCRDLGLQGEKHYGWKGGKVLRVCQICKKEFLVAQWFVRAGKAKFCSRSCHSIYEVKHSKKKGTGIELKVESILKELKVEYEPQEIISIAHTVVDFYLPEHNLIIYVDGAFWHKSDWAKKHGNIDKDCKHDFLLGMNGYKVLHLGEKEINEQPLKCTNKIKRLLKGE